MNKIYIYSGKVRSGKTTRLLQWASKQEKLEGIFQPVIDGKRFIYHSASKTLRLLETSSGSNYYRIGKYKLSKETFEWAKKFLLELFNKDFNWLVIDEVGHLELKGKGLEPVITELINNRKKMKCNIIFVVRESLVKKFIEHYKLAELCNNFVLPKP